MFCDANLTAQVHAPDKACIKGKQNMDVHKLGIALYQGLDNLQYTAFYFSHKEDPMRNSSII